MTDISQTPFRILSNLWSIPAWSASSTSVTTLLSLLPRNVKNRATWTVTREFWGKGKVFREFYNQKCTSSPSLLSRAVNARKHTQAACLLSVGGAWLRIKHTPNSSSLRHQWRSSNAEGSGIFRFWLKIMKPKNFFVWIDSHGWIVQHKTINLGEQSKYSQF